MRTIFNITALVVAVFASPMLADDAPGFGKTANAYGVLKTEIAELGEAKDTLAAAVTELAATNESADRWAQLNDAEQGLQVLKRQAAARHAAEAARKALAEAEAEAEEVRLSFLEIYGAYSAGIEATETALDAAQTELAQVKARLTMADADIDRLNEDRSTALAWADVAIKLWHTACNDGINDGVRSCRLDSGFDAFGATIGETIVAIRDEAKNTD